MERKPLRLILSLVVLIILFNQALYAKENLPLLFKKVALSVVVIITYDSDGKLLNLGSGFFVNKKAEVITNGHVIEGAYRAQVKMAGGKIYTVQKIMAEDREADLVRLSTSVPVKEVRPVTLSNTIPETGEGVLVIGSPQGLEQTLSEGIVSAVRDIPTIGKVLQVTAPISSGSSGSPVLNMKGEVVGVATLQIVEGQNLNFAMPCKRVRDLAAVKAFPMTERQKHKKPPGDDEFYKGVAVLSAGSYQKAINFFEEALGKNPNNAAAYTNIGFAYGKLGRHQEEIEAHKQAIKIKPDFAAAHYNLGLAYDEIGRHEEAIVALKEAIRIKPDYTEAYTNLGAVYGGLGRYQESITALKQAIKLNPTEAVAHNNLGAAYSERGLYKLAIVAHKEAIKINPDYADAHYNLGVTYRELGRHQEAVSAYKQAIRIKPDFFEAYTNLGLAYSKLGRYQEAISALKQAIRINPDDVQAHYGLGMSYLLSEDRRSALEEYEILKKVNTELANKLFTKIYK